MIENILKKSRRYIFGPSHPKWAELLRESVSQWETAKIKAKDGTNILLATSAGYYAPGTVIESMLAVALTLRGANVHALLCDKILPACMVAEIKKFPRVKQFAIHGPSKLCRRCFAPAEKMYRSLGVTVHKYSDTLSPADIESAEKLSSTISFEEIKSFKMNNLAVGEHAMAGALRFYARGNLNGEAYAEAVVRRYFLAALLTCLATQKLFDTHDFSCACFHHGIYVPQGIIGEVARQKGVHVVNWHQAYRKQCFIFSHNDTYHHTLLSEPIANWEQISWSAEIEADTLAYLKSRWQGTQDWICFNSEPREELSAIERELGVNFSRPCIGMLSNVIWDAQLHYPANAFSDMIDWALRTIQYFSERPDLQLIIRIHPAEIRGDIPSRQPMLDEIKKAFPTLPENVFVIPPESEISTYAVMFQCNAVIIYGTKTGVELSSLGIPVVVAGEAWIRGKKLTLDASSPEQYFKLLDRLPLSERLSPEDTQRARKYAYHFFFRRMIPLNFIKQQPGDWPPISLELKGLDDLMPNRSDGLDVICDGILTGSEFIYPAEKISNNNISR